MGSILKLLQDTLYRYAKIPSHWVNKFTIIGFIFFIWVGFIDSHSLWESYLLSRTLNRLENDKEFYIKNIEVAKADRKDLENNKEKFAREKYYMHADDEEVFIIERRK
jgi:cell division protein FtsB